MNKDDKLYKEVFEESSEILEDFLDNLSKLIKFSLVPIALIVSAVVVKFHNLLGPFGQAYNLFVAFWAGIITVLIFQTFAFKINAMDGNIFFKYFLKLSLLIFVGSIFISGILLAVNKLPENYKNTHQETEVQNTK